MENWVLEMNQSQPILTYLTKSIIKFVNTKTENSNGYFKQ